MEYDLRGATETELKELIKVQRQEIAFKDKAIMSLTSKSKLAKMFDDIHTRVRAHNHDCKFGCINCITCVGNKYSESKKEWCELCPRRYEIKIGY